MEGGVLDSFQNCLLFSVIIRIHIYISGSEIRVHLRSTSVMHKFTFANRVLTVFFGDIETPHGMYICIFNIYSDFYSIYWVILTYFFHITLQYNQHHIQLNISHQHENSGLSRGSVHMYCCNSHHMNLCRNLQFEKKKASGWFDYSNVFT